MRLWSAPKAFELLKKAGLPAKLGNALWLVYNVESYAISDRRVRGRAIRRGLLPKPPNLDMIVIVNTPLEELIRRSEDECAD